MTLATHTPADPREFLTGFGLTQPGTRASFKVFVILGTGNEAGSPAMIEERPGENTASPRRPACVYPPAPPARKTTRRPRLIVAPGENILVKSRKTDHLPPQAPIRISLPDMLRMNTVRQIL
ncbi:MAG: hypothetical protein J0M04_17330 [Verrucomicrobia bacterium]|nr:hypothetical protein [Verrucomicrobiota bacterium]